MLYSEAIKTIAESLSRIAEDLNKKGQYTDSLAALTEIINAEIELPVIEKSGKSSDQRFHYEGIDEIDKPVAERGDDFGIITFRVTKGDVTILTLSTDAECKWIYTKDAAGNWTPASRIKLNTKDKWSVSYGLRKLAEKEIATPGSFEEAFIPKLPTVCKVRESK